MKRNFSTFPTTRSNQK